MITSESRFHTSVADPTYYLASCSQKPHENERKLDMIPSLINPVHSHLISQSARAHTHTHTHTHTQRYGDLTFDGCGWVSLPLGGPQVVGPELGRPGTVTHGSLVHLHRHLGDLQLGVLRDETQSNINTNRRFVTPGRNYFTAQTPFLLRETNNFFYCNVLTNSNEVQGTLYA